MIRLLSLNNNTPRFTEFWDDDNIPPYAILSHTWLPSNDDEPSFADFNRRRAAGLRKRGYDKIRFCWEQAQAGGLQYIWVDTCCINKSNSTELSEAIHSMYRWYQQASKCYAYLSDVSANSVIAASAAQPWETDFRGSRWFKRGWTLQELLAPAAVHFFSSEGRHLGTKESMLPLIHEITRIPVAALNGDTPLESYSWQEKESWMEQRNTKRKEDKIYALFGICGQCLHILYGEGEAKARNRFRKACEEPESQEHGSTSRINPASKHKSVLPRVTYRRWTACENKKLIRIWESAGRTALWRELEQEFRGRRFSALRQHYYHLKQNERRRCKKNLVRKKNHR